MPEGDTIHHAAARISAVLEGRVPDAILMPQARHELDRWPERLGGRVVRAVDAYGKHLFLRFDGDLTLHSHLGVSGAWAVHRRGERWLRPRRRAWLVLRVPGHEVVEFDGPVLELMPEHRTRTHPRLAALGQDVLGPAFDPRRFLRALRADDQTRPIGDALLNQRTVAGIGNLWKSEACFAAGIDPWRAAGDLPDADALALVDFARGHMAQSARDGFIARPRAVYGRAGRPCPRCGTAIRRRRQWEDGRLTFWCPGCQR